MMRYFGLIVELFCVILKVGPSVSNLLLQTECSKSEITPVISDYKPEKTFKRVCFQENE